MTEQLPFSTKVFRLYKRRIYPKIRNIRGTTRIASLLDKFAKRKIPKIDSEPEPIYEKEWDNLIILDACRCDTYREVVNPDAECRTTVESHSRGFIRETFSEKDWSDTVLITANPFYNSEEFQKLTGRTLEDTFETVFHVYDTDWNDEEGTVMPGKMVEKAATAEKLFPEKRKIIHFMQPHFPFINSDFEENSFLDTLNSEKENVWQRAEKGELTNLKIAYEEVNSLKENLSGKTVVTADHGNLLGEDGFYSHPGGSNLIPLRKVPWDVISEN